MSTEKKLTAVEWLEDQLKGVPMIYDIGYLFNQAKEMEKQQIIDAQIKSLQTDFYVNYESPEQYYEETYKKD